jgi:hypothetical protein
MNFADLSMCFSPVCFQSFISHLFTITRSTRKEKYLFEGQSIDSRILRPSLPSRPCDNENSFLTKSLNSSCRMLDLPIPTFKFGFYIELLALEASYRINQRSSSIANETDNPKSLCLFLFRARCHIARL